MDNLVKMIERLKDETQEIQNEIRFLRRVSDFVDDLRAAPLDVHVDMSVSPDCQIDLTLIWNSPVEQDRDPETEPENTPALVAKDVQPEPAPKPAKRKLKPKTGPWSDREVDELIALRLEGKTAIEIAPLIDRDVKAVANKLYRIKGQIATAESEAQAPPEDAPSSEPQPEPTAPASPEAASPASPAPGGDAGSSSRISSPPAQPTGNGVRIRKRNGMAQDFCKAAIADHLNWVYAFDKAGNEQFWTPDLDLQLITILARGDGIPGAVSDLGRIEGAPDRAGFVDRVQTLMPHTTIDNQKFTLELLRERVSE